MFYGLLSKNFDQKTAKTAILDYAQKNQYLISDFLGSEDLSVIKSDDVLIVPNLSYFGLNLLKSLAACVSLGENGVQIHFIEQKKLSICGDKFADRLGTFREMLGSERGFISARAKEGMRVAKKNGAKLGRPRGSDNKSKILDKYKSEILDYMQKGISTVAIMKIINCGLEKAVSYFTFKNYVANLRGRLLCK